MQTTLGPREGKIQIGAGRVNRGSAGNAIWSGKGQWHASNDPDAPIPPKYTSLEQPPNKKGTRNGKMGWGKGEKKGNGKGGKGNHHTMNPEKAA